MPATVTLESAPLWQNARATRADAHPTISEAPEDCPTCERSVSTGSIVWVWNAGAARRCTPCALRIGMIEPVLRKA